MKKTIPPIEKQLKNWNRLTILFGILCGCMFLFLVGAVGAVEQDMMTLGQGIIAMAIGLILIILFYQANQACHRFCQALKDQIKISKVIKADKYWANSVPTKSYDIMEMKNDNIQAIAVCLKLQSFADYLNQLSTDNLIQKTSGRLLIDMLLLTGDSPNRFVEIQYDHGNFDFDTAKAANPEAYYRAIAAKLFRENPENLKASILTDAQCDAILSGGML